MPRKEKLFETNKLVAKHKLNTVCEEAKCPNRLECYSKQTATFLVLGSACTRACPFCDIDFAKNPKAPEEDEPDRVARFSKDLGLKHVVITMVARDDLPDGGASHVAKVIRKVRELNEGSTIEVLTSDLSNNPAAIDAILEESPEIFNHNIETVRRLTPRVRHRATYARTLDVLRYVHESKQVGFVKSGLMVGLGETNEEVKNTISDLYEVGCKIITIGQYLQANFNKLKVTRFVTPDEFTSYSEHGKKIGVMQMYCGPFVRSSYNAREILQEVSGRVYSGT